MNKTTDNKRRNNAKSGGSPASTDVVKFVSPDAFDKMNAMFTNSLTLSGGMNNSQRRLAQSVDMNETGQKMMLFHKTGGKKVVKAPAKKPVKRVIPKKPTKKRVQKGGDGGDCAAPASDSFGISVNLGVPPRNDNPLPPNTLPSQSPTSLSLCSIPQSQQALTSAPIDTLAPIYKSTVFPSTSHYSGTFAFGGGKKKAAAPKKKHVAKKTGAKKTGAKK
jgi:hypothetical protein